MPPRGRRRVGARTAAARTVGALTACVLGVSGGLAGCAVRPPGAPGVVPATTLAPLAPGSPLAPASAGASVGPASVATPADPLAGLVAAPAASERPSRGGAVLAPTASGPLTGRTILVDPGHNGIVAPAINNRLVPAGNGATKVCNTSGTEAVDGTGEHAVNWAIGVRLVGLLRARGATVVLSRVDDAGVGPCVDERAALAARGGVDLVLSIHGDGADVASARGFHVIVSTTMAGGAALADRSAAVAGQLVAELDRWGQLPRSTYLGGGSGIDRRTDIAGLNLLTGAPGVMLEMGNLRNADDWAVLKTDAARAAIAEALATTAEHALAR